MTIGRFVSRQALSIVCALVLLGAGVPLAAQQAPPPPAQLLSPDQLDNLVAPVALYPDSLLGQVLVASTYPLEVVEAGQWLQQNRNLQGPQLVAAARQQNWDASIQALVVFPDALYRLSSNVQWTTDLGNAFLAQQADVMNAVQRMRARAQQAGRLNSNADQTVTTETQGGQSAIDIQPTNPQVVYVPVYNPEYVWGPPLWGYYPPLWYPAFGFGFGFGPGIYIGSFFGGLGWGGWGWWPNWFGFGIFERPFFFTHFGYAGFVGGRFGAFGVWAHDPVHRLGVPYSTRALASRFHGSYGTRGAVAGERFGAQRMSPGASEYRGNAGAGARAGEFGRNSAQGGWSHFGESRPGVSQGYERSAPSYQRATPSYGSNRGFSGEARSYRSTPSNGGGRSSRSSASRGSSGGHHSSGGFHSSGGGSHGSHGGGSHGGGRR